MVTPALGIAKLVLLTVLAGDGALPFGLPPAQEDPVLLKAMPKDCLLALSWAGSADADPKSKNHTEQLLAEPEVRRLCVEVEKLMLKGIRAQFEEGDPASKELGEAAIRWTRLLLTRPAALYVSNFEMGPDGPMVQGGALVNVGDQAADLQAFLDKLNMEMLGGGAEKVEVAGATLYRFQPDPKAPEFTAGLKGEHFVLGVGAGTVEAMFAADADTPAWLVGLREKAAVVRPIATMHVNLTLVREKTAALWPPEAAGVLERIGVDKVTALSWVCGLDDSGFVTRVIAQADGEPAGLLAALDGAPLTAADLAPLPRDAIYASAARVDALKLYDVVLDLATAIEPAGREQFERDLGQAEEALGFKIRDELLAGLGDAWTFHLAPEESGWFGVAAAARVRDRAKLENVQRQLLANAPKLLGSGAAPGGFDIPGSGAEFPAPRKTEEKQPAPPPEETDPFAPPKVEPPKKQPAPDERDPFAPPKVEPPKAETPDKKPTPEEIDPFAPPKAEPPKKQPAPAEDDPFAPPADQAAPGAGEFSADDFSDDELDEPKAEEPSFDPPAGDGEGRDPFPVRPADEFRFGRSQAAEARVSKFGEHEIHYLVIPDAPVQPAWVITDDWVYVGLYPQTVKAMLSRGAEYRSLAEHPDVQKVLVEPNKPLAITYQDTRRIHQMLYPFVQMGVRALASQMQREGVEVDYTWLPSGRAIHRHLQPTVSAVLRTEYGLEARTHETIPASGNLSGWTLTLLGGVAEARGPLGPGPSGPEELIEGLAGALSPAKRAETQSMNNLKQIGLAIHNFHDTHVKMPGAYTADADGKPLLSWRVQVLPYLEQSVLYEKFKLDEPWDSEHNKKLIAEMPGVYRAPGSKTPPEEGKTNYVAPRHKSAIFSDDKGRSLAAITDGTSNTMMVVEASDDAAVIWTKPDDLDFAMADLVKTLVGLRKGGFLAVFADGSVQKMPATISAEDLNALMTRDGGEVVDRWSFDAGARRSFGRAEFKVAPPVAERAAPEEFPFDAPIVDPKKEVDDPFAPPKGKPEPKPEPKPEDLDDPFAPKPKEDPRPEPKAEDDPFAPKPKQDPPKAEDDPFAPKPKPEPAPAVEDPFAP